MMYLRGRADLGLAAALKAVPLALGLAAAARAIVDRRLQSKCAGAAPCCGSDRLLAVGWLGAWVLPFVTGCWWHGPRPN